MQVCVDGMITKSVKEIDHLKDFEETFKVLRLYNMKHNLSKYTFRSNLKYSWVIRSIKEE